MDPALMLQGYFLPPPRPMYFFRLAQGGRNTKEHRRTFPALALVAMTTENPKELESQELQGNYHKAGLQRAMCLCRRLAPHQTPFLARGLFQSPLGRYTRHVDF